MRFFLPGVASPTTPAKPRSELALGGDRFAGAQSDKILIVFRNSVLTLSRPGLRLLERESHQQRIDPCLCLASFPSARRARSSPAAPDQEFALGGDPFPELAPALENRLVRDFGVGFARLGRGRDRAADRDSRRDRRRAATPRRRTRREIRAAASARRPHARSRASSVRMRLIASSAPGRSARNRSARSTSTRPRSNGLLGQPQRAVPALQHLLATCRQACRRGAAARPRP